MKRQQWGMYAVALAILVVGLVWAGVPASTLLVAGLVLVCPVMMFVMMRGMHGGDASGHDTSHDHQHHGTADRTDDPHARPPLDPPGTRWSR
jgi:multisubunit Na+/H+ antiporter MnhG subunit